MSSPRSWPPPTTPADAPPAVRAEALALLRRTVAHLEAAARTQAWDDVWRAVELAPDDGAIRALAARVLFVLGDGPAALAEATAAVQHGAPAAMQRAAYAREIGAYHDARAALEQVLDGGAAAGQNARADDALEQLLRLYCNADHFQGACAALERYLPLVRPSSAFTVQAARVYQRGGATGRARALIADTLAGSPTPSTALGCGELLVEIGAFDEARAVFAALVDDQAAGAQALAALGRLRLWVGDVTGALAFADRLCARDPRSTAGRRIQAAVDVLRGAAAAALPRLDAVLADDPGDGEAYLWRAEAHLRLGDDARALADIQHSGAVDGDFFAAGVLRLLVDLNRDRSRYSPVRRLTSRRAGAIETLASRALRPFVYAPGIAAHARREFAGELGAICGRPAALARNNAVDLAALLNRSLAAMRGNRTPVGTWVRDDGTLARLPQSASARVASRHVLELIRVATPEETLRQFDALIARFPDSSMPLVHRGELHLWLGRYAEARADLDAAIAKSRQTRWAWYGLACLDLLAGDPERALATCALGIRVMDNTEGPVAFLYRGEAYRRLGRLDDARAQLVRSCELHPSRLSAWINLGLVHGAAADRAAQRETLRRLVSVAPHFLAAAAAESGDDAVRAVILERGDATDAVADRVLSHALAMMRGNRASGCITYFTADGRMRCVTQRRADGVPGGRSDRPDSGVLAAIRRAIDGIPVGPSQMPSSGVRR